MNEPQWGARRVFETKGGVITAVTRQAAMHLVNGSDGAERYELVSRPGGSEGPWELIQLLPPLDMPCPHCTTDTRRREIAAAHRAWAERESAAFQDYVERWKAEHDGEHQGAAAAWDVSPAKRVIDAEEPDAPDQGCGECDWRSVVVTDAGRQLLEFLHRWQAPPRLP